MYRYKTGMKIIFLLFRAIFSQFKRFTKSAVARPTGLDTPQTQLLHVRLSVCYQNVPFMGLKFPSINEQSLLKNPYFSTFNPYIDHYGLRRLIILVGDFEGTLMKGSRYVAL